MKQLAFLLISFSFIGCAFIKPRMNHHVPARKVASTDEADIDTLEKLLLNEQQPLSRARYESGNLRLGMRKSNVERSLGSPKFVEVAGNPKYGNERWIYERSVPTLDGYYREMKVIYFEGGSVVGWESH